MTSPDRLYTRPALKKLFLESSGIPEWLLTRCQKETSDLAETLARCWPVEGAGWGEAFEAELDDRFSGLKDPEVLVEFWGCCSTPERIRVNRRLLGSSPREEGLPPPDPDTPRKEIQAELMYAVLSGEPDYSFGLWRGAERVSVVRVSVSDPRLSVPLLKYIQANTTEKKGPVRVVAPGLVGRISYTGLRKSDRHKCGFKIENPCLESLFPPGGLWRADTVTEL